MHEKRGRTTPQTLRVAFVVKVDLSVLCLRLKITRIMPSHSVKFTGGGGLRSSIRTTRESTLGGGRKLFRFTCASRDETVGPG